MITRDPTTHAGKLFDYLGTGKPILALALERLDRGEARVNPDRATIDSYSWQCLVDLPRFTGLGLYARPSGGR